MIPYPIDAPIIIKGINATSKVYLLKMHPCYGFWFVSLSVSQSLLHLPLTEDIHQEVLNLIEKGVFFSPLSPGNHLWSHRFSILQHSGGMLKLIQHIWAGFKLQLQDTTAKLFQKLVFCFSQVTLSASAAILTWIMQNPKATTPANPKARLTGVMLSDFPLDKQKHQQLSSYPVISPPDFSERP